MSILFVIATGSALFVYWDATKNKIGRLPSEKGLFNMTAGSWAFSMFLIWIVAFPAYLLKRKGLIEKAQNHPIEVSGRGIKLTIFTVIFLLVTSSYYNKQQKIGKLKKAVQKLEEINKQR